MKAHRKSFIRKGTQAAELRDARFIPPPRGNSRKALVTWQLDLRRRAFEAGNLLALRDALIFCYQEHRPLPLWAMGVILHTYDGTLFETPAGRACARRYCQDQIDFQRAEAVFKAHEDGFKFNPDSAGNPTAYEEAAKRLRGSVAAAGKRIMERSYKNLKREFRKNPFRYYQLSSVTFSKPL